jgi:hypothetical protein
MTSIARIALPRYLWDRVKLLAQSRSMKPTEWLACVVEEAARRQSVATPPPREADRGRTYTIVRRHGRGTRTLAARTSSAVGRERIPLLRRLLPTGWRRPGRRRHRPSTR